MFPGDTSRFARPGRIPGVAPVLPLEPDLLTTRAAATYCGYKTPSALRKAYFDGRVMPVGRRGGGGPLMWRRADLDQFLGGALTSVTRATDLVVIGPPESGRTKLGDFITCIAGPNTMCRVGISISKGELVSLVDAGLLIIEDFDPGQFGGLGSAVLEKRRELRRPTVVIAQTPPSTWARFARSPSARRALHRFLALAYLVRLAPP